MRKSMFLLCVLLTIKASAQTGIIKGRVIDQQSELPLSGVTIELLSQNGTNATITNDDGYYKLDNVLLGRQSINVSYIGYETNSATNIIVLSGKDAVMDIKLVESFTALNTVVISSKKQKNKAINTMTSVSARQFGMEEVQRFSGGRSDVGRLAANFAGVSAPDDSRNDIVIRGNSPSGLLYRLEGIPIPNPNHFSSLGTSGGAVSAINPNLLKDSDFLTSAFPAEYGNAVGGVFDLGFRTGNKDDYEFTVQAGAFTGIEALAEGPLGKKNGSFLVAGRYSLVGLLGGAGGTTATPNYSDISFNLDLGEGKAGNLSIFGILGNSDIEFLGSDIDKDDLFAAQDQNLAIASRFGVVGLKHKIRLNNNSYIQSVVSTSYTKEEVSNDRYINKEQPDERLILFSKTDNSDNRFTFSSLLNSKINSKVTLRTGFLVENFTIKSFLSNREKQPDNNNDGNPDLFIYRDINENLSIIQPYIQSQYRITEKLTLNAGLHSQYSTLSKQFVIEPRTGLQYKAGQDHTISLGYGIHHQSISTPILFLNEKINGELVQTNRDLGFVRSDHIVIGYDVRLARSWRAKFEAYYQYIKNAAVDPFPSSYSSLTEGATFTFNNDRVSLVNEGKGHNKGVEITLEKFFSNGYYGLLTTSIFESKYKGSDGINRNSPFNNGYVANLLGGREFKIGKEKQNVLFTDMRLSTAGGRYYTPVNLQASQNAGYEILREEDAFSERNSSYLRLDFKIGYKLNLTNKKQSHQFYIDLQNVTNRDNIFAQRYNRVTNEVNQINQIGFFPDLGYKFQF